MDVTVGQVSVTISDESVAIEGEAVNGGRQSGLVVPCEIHTPDGGILEVGLTSWEHGDRDVRCFKRLAGPIMYDRLVHGARLGVAGKRDGEWDTELGILRFHDDRHPTVVKAAWEDLDTVLAGSAQQFLLDRGASRVGTKETVIGDTGKRRGYLMMVSPAHDSVPPILAYTLTRVLPLLTGFGSSAAVPEGLA